jgi:hypothetical protein
MPNEAVHTIAVPSAAQLASLTVVGDGESFIVGSPRMAEYVEVPELGAKIIEWLQQGLDVPECERRAAELAGEPVDVVDGTVALSVGVIEAGLGCEVVEPSSPLVAADVGVRRVPVPAGGDRGRGALVSAVQSVLSGC